MTRNKIRVVLLAAMLAPCAMLAASSSTIASPQGATPASSAPQAQKIIKVHFVVMHMLYQSLQVRGVTDMREIHTFSYSPGIRNKMQSLFNAGGYQYGDKVTVWYRSGDDVALKISGKPSKAK